MEVKITDVETTVRNDAACMTVDLDNFDRYGVQVVTDSVGNVYVFIQHRSGTIWSKTSLKNGVLFDV